MIVGVRAFKNATARSCGCAWDIRLLLVEPGAGWNRKDMAEALQGTGRQNRCSLEGGALDDRWSNCVTEPKSQKSGKPIVLSDFKHYAANVLKIVGSSRSFVRFMSQMGSTRSAIQQTELGHLTPPSPRPKARFMNLAATLTWAGMALWPLTHPHSKARREITAARIWKAGLADNISRRHSPAGEPARSRGLRVDHVRQQAGPLSGRCEPADANSNLQ